MDITSAVNADVLDVVLDGRLDGYWADHLDRALADIVRDGHHRIRLDCAKLSFLSSAGIGVLVKFHKELARINGTFQLTNPSKTVAKTLQISRLADLLIAQAPVAAAVETAKAPARRLERDGASFEVYELDPAAKLTCRAVGTTTPLTNGAVAGEHCVSLDSLKPTFAIGVGAFGSGFSDCQSRFGELLSVAGATAYQPTDEANVPDYLVHAGGQSDVHVLYCLACEGRFSHVIRFEALAHGGTVGMGQLLAGCLETAGTSSIGVVVVAEAAGLVGASLRRSPAAPTDDTDFFAHPAVRTRLEFTAEPAYAREVALVAGVVTRLTVPDAERSTAGAQLRPLGAEYHGHLHAAAFRFHAIKKGPIDLAETVTGLFGADHQLLGVLHLLHDDRRAGGAGESEFVRGACWVGPIADGWERAS